MKKILFMSMIMQKMDEPYYNPSEKSLINLTKKFYFPVSVKLTEVLRQGDELTICVLKMVDGATHNNLNHYAENLALLKIEVDEISKLAGANVTYKEIESDFSETQDAFGKRFMDMFEILEENCTIYADITFGTKPTSFLIFNLLKFAEKFYDADIDSIIYGRVLYKDEGEKSKIDPSTAKICDVTILYLLDNLTSVLNLPDGESAKETLKQFFNL